MSPSSHELGHDCTATILRRDSGPENPLSSRPPGDCYHTPGRLPCLGALRL